MQSRRRFDPNSPEIRAYRQEVRNATFTREGTMVAFPTCLPGETIPITHDESHITALDVTPDGTIYGGTSGKQAHVFLADFHGESGIVFDIGAVSGATACCAVCWSGSRVLAFVNGDREGRAVAMRPLPAPRSLIQEWGLSRPALQDIGVCVAGEPVVHAVADASRSVVVGTTHNHLFTVDFQSAKVQVAGEVQGNGRIAVASKGAIVGGDGATHLWRYDPKAGTLNRRAVPLPEGAWGHPLVWARDSRNGLLYTADGEGRLFSFDETNGFSGPLARAPLAPVNPMAVTLDGRLFGFCGAEISKMFCYHPGRREVSTLGVAVSVLERRRYGYVFGDAVTGREGEIIFGEDDNGGHLWLYFPRIQPLA